MINWTQPFQSAFHVSHGRTFFQHHTLSFHHQALTSEYKPPRRCLRSERTDSPEGTLLFTAALLLQSNCKPWVWACWNHWPCKTCWFVLNVNDDQIEACHYLTFLPLSNYTHVAETSKLLFVVCFVPLTHLSASFSSFLMQMTVTTAPFTFEMFTPQRTISDELH